MPYSKVSTGNNKSGGYGNLNETKEHRSAQGKGRHAGCRFGQGS